MEHVEIETGVRPANGKWGYVVHYYKDTESFGYLGNSGPHGACESEEEARKEAAEWLDEMYGKRGWKHI